MLDNELKPFLIEANSNPCLENSGVILGKLIYDLIDNVLMTAVDPLFPAPRYSFFDLVRADLRNISAKTILEATNLN